MASFHFNIIHAGRVWVPHMPDHRIGSLVLGSLVLFHFNGMIYTIFTTWEGTHIYA